jgi:hypothetical protein
LLIDSTHRSWIAVTAALTVAAIALHAWLGADIPGGLTGGTPTGLWYGVAGSLLMIFAGALSAHRRLAAIRRLPMRRWLGPRQTWLRGHIWLGLLSFVLILCHSDYHLGGPLTIALWVVFAVTIVSGIAGLVFQAVLPRMITNRIAAEAPYEQVPHLCDGMRREAEEIVDRSLAREAIEEPVKKELQILWSVARPFLQAEFDRTSPLAKPLRAEVQFGRVRAVPGMAPLAADLNRLELLCEERRQLGEQVRLHGWLHFWLLAHVPITIALLILSVVHVATAVYW